MGAVNMAGSMTPGNHDFKHQLQSVADFNQDGFANGRRRSAVAATRLRHRSAAHLLRPAMQQRRRGDLLDVFLSLRKTFGTHPGTRRRHWRIGLILSPACLAKIHDVDFCAGCAGAAGDGLATLIAAVSGVFVRGPVAMVRTRSGCVAATPVFEQSLWLR